MEFASIASGSSGNCLYAASEETHLLIDAGISKKRIETGLASLQVHPEQLDGILITHEHADHISGLGVMSRKYHIPIYATCGTISEIKRSRTLGDIDAALFREIRAGQEFAIRDMEIQSFSIPHDAIDPVSYNMSDGHQKIGMVTDLGYFDEHIIDPLKACNLLYIEANHDIRMLETGPYPFYLKRRIAGNNGHLCNEMAGELICRLYNTQLKHIILGHLSKENNYPDLALMTVNQVIAESDVFKQVQDISVCVAPRDRALSLITI